MLSTAGVRAAVGNIAALLSRFRPRIPPKLEESRRRVAIGLESNPSLPERIVTIVCSMQQPLSANRLNVAIAAHGGFLPKLGPSRMAAFFYQRGKLGRCSSCTAGGARSPLSDCKLVNSAAVWARRRYLGPNVDVVDHLHCKLSEVACQISRHARHLRPVMRLCRFLQRRWSKGHGE